MTPYIVATIFSFLDIVLMVILWKDIKDIKHITDQF